MRNAHALGCGACCIERHLQLLLRSDQHIVATVVGVQDVQTDGLCHMLKAAHLGAVLLQVKGIEAIYFEQWNFSVDAAVGVLIQLPDTELQERCHEEAGRVHVRRHRAFFCAESLLTSLFHLLCNSSMLRSRSSPLKIFSDAASQVALMYS